jgi:hypothetical protein
MSREQYRTCTKYYFVIDDRIVSMHVFIHIISLHVYYGIIGYWNILKCKELKEASLYWKDYPNTLIIGRN